MASVGSSPGEGCPIPKSIMPGRISFCEEEAAVMDLTIFQTVGFVNWKFPAAVLMDS
jgi:hypothetical protein